MSSDESSEEIEVKKVSNKRKSDAKPSKSAKKQKKTKQDSSSDDSSGVDDPTPVKKGKKTEVDDANKPDPKSITLGKTKFVTVNEFRGRKRVDIRDYYLGKDGKLLPTKKGISLAAEEFALLKDNIDKISKLLD